MTEEELKEFTAGMKKLAKTLVRQKYFKVIKDYTTETLELNLTFQETTTILTQNFINLMSDIDSELNDSDFNAILKFSSDLDDYVYDIFRKGGLL